MRIISLAPSNTEILFALGLEGQIVAVTNLCKYPPAANTKPKIGSWIKTNVEEIKSYHPDLIFTSYFLPPELAEGNYSGPGRIVHLNPRTLTDVFDSILQIGELTERIPQAEKIVADMKSRIEKISAGAMAVESKPRVYSEEWNEPPMVGGNWVPELIELAGGREELIQPGEMSRRVTEQEIFDYQPDLIILHWCGWGDRDARPKFVKRESWRNLTAARENRVCTIDDSLLNSPGPRLIEGLEKIHHFVTELSVLKT